MLKTKHLGNLASPHGQCRVENKGVADKFSGIKDFDGNSDLMPILKGIPHPGMIPMKALARFDPARPGLDPGSRLFSSVLA